MKKLRIALLLLLFAGMQSLVAQDAAVEAEVAHDAAVEAEVMEVAKDQAGNMINLAVTADVDAIGRMYLAGPEVRRLNNPVANDDSEAVLTVAMDYNEIVGARVELSAPLFTSTGTRTLYPNLGDTYAYVHALQAFGVDPKMFDVYVQSGYFEALVGAEAKNAGQDTWSDVADVDTLESDPSRGNRTVNGGDSGKDRINMQVDLKSMDMLSFRYVVAFNPFEEFLYNTTTGKLTPGQIPAHTRDMGFALLFDKAFGPHHIMASAGYAFDLDNNEGTTPEGDSKVIATNAQIAASGEEQGGYYFDDLAFSLAYAGTFGTIKVMPFFDMRIQGVMAYPNNAIGAPRTNWSAGVKFQLLDANGGYDLFGAGLDMGGIFYDSLLKFNNKRIEKGLEGIGLKVWSAALKGIMGSQYLSFWAAVRFEFWDLPEADRSSYLSYWGFGLNQYFVNTADASVKLFAEFSVENIAPFKVKDIGYVSGSGTTPTAVAASTPLEVFVDLGLEASFTARITKQVN